MAARVAAALKKESDLDVTTVKGGIGEFSVHIDGQKVIDTNRLWYPSVGGTVRKIQALLRQQDEKAAGVP